MNASQRGRSNKRRGADAERELARKLNEYGFDVRRGYVQSHEADVVGLDGIHIECKFVRNVNLSEAMIQAVNDANRMQDGLPAVFTRKPRTDWLVVMRLEDWIELYRKGQG